jgi:hypothetical protein
MSPSVQEIVAALDTATEHVRLFAETLASAINTLRLLDENALTPEEKQAIENALVRMVQQANRVDDVTQLISKDS